MILDQDDLFEKPKPRPDWREINISGIEVRRGREFGQVWVALALWRRLGLDRLLAGLMPKGREEIRWDLIACVLTSAKFCEQDTENAMVGEWLPQTALCDVLGLDEEKLNLTRMYRGLDEILAHKDALCASRSLLKRYESEFHDASGWQSIREGLSVKLVKGDGNERYVLCKSADRAMKEQSMLQRQLDKFRAGIEKKSSQLAGKPSRKTQSLQQGIGRLRERYPSASKHFECEVLFNEENEACGIALNEKPGQLEWAEKTHGAYILRTNMDCEAPAELWRWYIQLTEAESAFRDLKSDLALRPIYHHLQRRVEAHILVCFLSLCLWRTLEHWMGVSGLGDEARQFLAEMRQIHSMDVHLPTKQGQAIKLRVVSKPAKELAVLLARMKLRLPNVPLELKL